MTINTMLDLAIIQDSLANAYTMMNDDYEKEAKQLLVMIIRIQKDLNDMTTKIKKEI